MRLEAVEVVRVDLAMRRPVGTSAGWHRERPVVYVRVLADEAEGWGECAALGEGTLVDPGLAEVAAALSEVGAPRLGAAAAARGGQLPPAAAVGQLFGSSAVDRMVAAALEMAVLDAELRLEGQPLWRRLGVPAAVAETGVAVGEVVGIPVERDLDAVVAAAADATTRARRVRLKIAPGWDVEPVAAVRRAFPALDLQVDANGAYRLDGDGPDSVEHLVALDAYRLTCIEQPLAPPDLAALAEAARRIVTPVCLDESLATERRLADALRYGACEVACLKPGRLGGLLAARRAVATCAEAGIGAFVGGFFETGLGRAANVALAGLPGFTLPGDLSAPAGYLMVDPAPGPRADGAVIRPYGDPGVAPAPDAGVLAGLGARRQVCRV